MTSKKCVSDLVVSLFLFILLFFSTSVTKAQYKTYKAIHERIEKSEIQTEAEQIFEKRVPLKIKTEGPEPLIITPEEAVEILKGNISETLQEKSINTSFNIFNLSAYLTKGYNQQKEWWDLEKDLIERYRVWPMYSNDLGEDGSFEHLEDWQDLDLLLFGKNATVVKAPFNDPASKIAGKTTASTNQKGTSVKTSRPKPEPPSDPETNSIAELLEKSSKYLNTVWSGEVSEKSSGELNDTKPELDSSSAGSVAVTLLPSGQNSTPETETVAEVEDIQVLFQGYDESVLTEVACEKLIFPVTPITFNYQALRASTEECEKLRDIEFAGIIEGIEKRGNINAGEIYGVRIPEILKTHDDHIFAWLESTQTMEENLKTLSEKICLVTENGYPCPL